MRFFAQTPEASHKPTLGGEPKNCSISDTKDRQKPHPQTRKSLKIQTGHPKSIFAKTNPRNTSAIAGTIRTSLPYTPGNSPQWTTMVYDAIGRTVQVQQPASSGTSTTMYAGNTVTLTDPAGRWKRYTSDALGQLTQVTEPNPQGGANYETYYTYNAAGQMTQVSMPRPNVGLPGTTTQTRTFTYNTSGYLTAATNPENGTTQYFYTANGLLDYKLDAKGQKVKYTYDALERVSKIEPFVNSSATTPIDCEVVTNNYDQWAGAIGRLSSQVWGDKDLTKCPKGEVRYEYQYSATGKVTNKKLVVKQRRQDPLDNNNWKDYEADLPVAYEYTYGLHTKTTYPTTNPYETYWNGSAWVTGFNTLPGHVYNYTYDTQNRPSGATYQVNPVANPQTMVQGVTYNAFSQMTQMQWLNNPDAPWQGFASQQWTYDSLLRLTGIPTMGITYQYSPNNDDGKITSMTYTAAGYAVNYTYDSLGRLATANTNGNQWGLSYLYDGFGNRLQQNVTKAGPGFTPPSSNLFVDPNTNRVNSWTYDANGNATNIPGVGNIAFDWANRVSTVGSESYGYDPGNKRLWKNAQLTLWGGRGEEIGRFELQWLLDTWTETTISGTQTYTAWKLKFKQNSTLRYFAGRKLQHVDRLGSANGTFYPYGEEVSSAVANPADKFATYHRDGTGLDYASQRFYVASAGRFVSVDPAQAGTNFYSYTNGDPVNSSDPTGLRACWLQNRKVVCQEEQARQVSCPPNPSASEVCAVPDDIVTEAAAYEAYLAYYRYLATVTTNNHGVPPALPVANNIQSARALQRLVGEGIVNDCEAMAMYIDEASLGVEAARLGNRQTAAFMATMGVFVDRAETGVQWAGRLGITIYASATPVVLQQGNNGRASGYADQFRDTLSPNQDQGHHLSAYMSLGFGLAGLPGGVLAANAAGYVRDTNNPGDRELAYAAIQIGADLQAGRIGIRDVANRVRQLCR